MNGINGFATLCNEKATRLRRQKLIPYETSSMGALDAEDSFFDLLKKDFKQ